MQFDNTTAVTFIHNYISYTYSLQCMFVCLCVCGVCWNVIWHLVHMRGPLMFQELGNGVLCLTSEGP